MKPSIVKSNNRFAFSLVELLVAMAIIIFMLTIMSQAFVIATTCMSGLKGVGELIDKSKPVLNILQKDLSAYHFEGTKRLSDSNFWVNGPPLEGYFTIYQDKPFSNNEAPPTGTADGVPVVRSGPDANHMLIFTSRLNGQDESEFYSAELPPDDPMNSNFKFNTFSSVFNNFPNFTSSSTSKKYGKNIDITGLVPTSTLAILNLQEQNSSRYENYLGKIHSKWAEIAYFVEPNGKFANGSLPGAPLGTLYRQQKILLPQVACGSPVNIPSGPSPICSCGPLKLGGNNIWSYDLKNGKQSKNNFYEISTFDPGVPNKIFFPTSQDLTSPYKRMIQKVITYDGGLSSGDPLNPYPIGHPGYMKDILLENIISFDVRVLVDNYLDFIPLSNLYALGYTNLNKVLNPDSAVRQIFDTWSKENDITGVSLPFADQIYDQGNLNPLDGTWMPNAAALPNSKLLPFWNNTTKKGVQFHAIQVSIRIWDEKSQKAREFKLIQRL